MPSLLRPRLLLLDVPAVGPPSLLLQLLLSEIALQQLIFVMKLQVRLLLLGLLDDLLELVHFGILLDGVEEQGPETLARLPSGVVAEVEGDSLQALPHFFEKTGAVVLREGDLHVLWLSACWMKLPWPAELDCH